jgi:hypothetical protein
MGQPATPSPRERAETRALCQRIVQSVIDDASMPLPIDWPTKVPLDCPCCPVSDVEDLVMSLAQEVVALQQERDEAIERANDICEHCQERCEHRSTT